VFGRPEHARLDRQPGSDHHRRAGGGHRRSRTGDHGGRASSCSYGCRGVRRAAVHCGIKTWRGRLDSERRAGRSRDPPPWRLMTWHVPPLTEPSSRIRHESHGRAQAAAGTARTDARRSDRGRRSLPDGRARVGCLEASLDTSATPQSWRVAALGLLAGGFARRGLSSHKRLGGVVTVTTAGVARCAVPVGGNRADPDHAPRCGLRPCPGPNRCPPSA